MARSAIAVLGSLSLFAAFLFLCMVLYPQDARDVDYSTTVVTPVLRIPEDANMLVDIGSGSHGEFYVEAEFAAASTGTLLPTLTMTLELRIIRLSGALELAKPARELVDQIGKSISRHADDLSIPVVPDVVGDIALGWAEGSLEGRQVASIGSSYRLALLGAMVSGLLCVMVQIGVAWRLLGSMASRECG